jgi:hypothetical protein
MGKPRGEFALPSHPGDAEHFHPTAQLLSASFRKIADPDPLLDGLGRSHEADELRRHSMKVTRPTA